MGHYINLMESKVNVQEFTTPKEFLKPSPLAGGQGAKTGLYAVLTPARENKRQNGRRMKEDGEPSFTLTSQDIHGVCDGQRIRRLTPTECERLQGFPDDWTADLSDSQRYKCLGNAVTVNVIKAIMIKINKGELNVKNDSRNR